MSKVPLWVRELGHFGGWAILTWGLSYFVDGLLPIWASGFSPTIAAGMMLIATWKKEFQERETYHQTSLKTFWDLVAKTAGIAAAWVTPDWWTL